MRKVILVLFFFSLPSTLWAADPIIGTWKLNVEKSYWPPGAEGRILKEEYFTGKDLGNQYEITVTQTRADGSGNTATALYPRQGGIIKIDKQIFPEGNLLIFVVINPYEHYTIRLQDDKQVEISHQVYGKDGKTMRSSIREYDPQRNLLEIKLVWERQ